MLTPEPSGAAVGLGLQASVAYTPMSTRARVAGSPGAPLPHGRWCVPRGMPQHEATRLPYRQPGASSPVKGREVGSASQRGLAGDYRHGRLRHPHSVSKFAPSTRASAWVHSAESPEISNKHLP